MSYPSILSFDVESLGLYGKPFAVGAVLYERGKEVSTFFSRLSEDVVLSSEMSTDDRLWISENILSHLPAAPAVETELELIQGFFRYWESQSYPTLLTDCCFPVETNFLHRSRDVMGKKFRQPYPLLDVASVLHAAGMDPLGTYDRLASELPSHNPVNDARQSARLYWSVMKKMKSNPGDS